MKLLEQVLARKEYIERYQNRSDLSFNVHNFYLFMDS